MYYLEFMGVSSGSTAIGGHKHGGVVLAGFAVGFGIKGEQVISSYLKFLPQLGLKLPGKVWYLSPSAVKVSFLCLMAQSPNYFYTMQTRRF